MLGVALVAGLVLSPQTLATPILGMSVSTDMPTVTGYDITNVINGSGLASGPALSGQHANASTSNAWLSTVTSGSLIIDLGGDYDLSGFYLLEHELGPWDPQQQGQIRYQ